MKIIERILQQEMRYRGNVILTYQIKYPEIENKENEFGLQRFNWFNKVKALQLQRYCERELFQEAKKIYEYNVTNGYPIMIYEILLEYQITYQKERVISVYEDQYMFTGGAHGTTIRSSQTWNLKQGRMIPLAFFFPNNPYYMIDIIKEINHQIAEQIEKGENQYFDNYCKLVLENFKVEKYYLTEKEIVIYFQEYEIAPYSSGIPTFMIKT